MNALMKAAIVESQLWELSEWSYDHKKCLPCDSIATSGGNNSGRKKTYCKL